MMYKEGKTLPPPPVCPQVGGVSGKDLAGRGLAAACFISPHCAVAAALIAGADSERAELLLHSSDTPRFKDVKRSLRGERIALINRPAETACRALNLREMCRGAHKHRLPGIMAPRENKLIAAIVL